MLKKVIKLSAKWCNPCKRLAPIFEEISKLEEFKDIEFKSVDVDDDEDMLTEKYQVRSVPTIILVDENGDSIKKLIGLLPSKDDYIREIREELAKIENTDVEPYKESEESK